MRKMRLLVFAIVAVAMVGFTACANKTKEEAKEVEEVVKEKPCDDSTKHEAAADTTATDEMNAEEMETETETTEE